MRGFRILEIVNDADVPEDVRDGAPVRSHRFHVVGDLRVVASDGEER
jgi:hypothetical protein